MKVAGWEYRSRSDPPVVDVVEDGEGRHGIHAQIRAKSSLEHVCHARASRWRWSERRPSVDAGNAGEPVGEVHVL
jgi:hypothetical protein